MVVGSNEASDRRLVEICHLFYDEGLSKSEIARLHQMSITHVNRLLREAQKKHIVEVTIRSPRFEELESKLVRGFDLVDARVVQTTSDADSLRKELSEQAAEYLESRLADGTRIGVTSGRTVFETVSRISERPRSISVYPLNAVANSDAEIRSVSANTAATILWFKCRPHAKAFRVELFSPEDSIEAIRKSVRISLSRHETSSIASQIGNLDIYLLGVSELREDSQLVALSGRCGADFSNLSRAGIVGDVAFNTINEGGDFVPSGLESLLFRVEHSSLQSAAAARNRAVILIGGGPERLPTIRAALAGRLFNVLVTDSDTAQALALKPLSGDLAIPKNSGRQPTSKHGGTRWRKRGTLSIQ